MIFFSFRLKFLYMIRRWQHRHHLHIITFVLISSSILSYFLPFGLIFHLENIVAERPNVTPYRNRLIAEQISQQKLAFDWLNFLWKNFEQFSSIISNETFQSRFYDFIQISTIQSNFSSSYKLFERPKRFVHLTNRSTTNDPILISILYSQQDTDYRQGKFYVGQVLAKLLKTYQTSFIITLCENENSEIYSSETIDLIRRLVPVFLVKSKLSPTLDIFEQEKQAHLQCILANFQSFPTANYLILLQDDAEPIGKDFYWKIRSLIDTRIKRQWPLDGSRSQPAFIKIYHPRWLTDYLHPSIYIIVQLIATSLFLTGILFGSISFFQKFQKLNMNHWIIYFILITIVLILFNHSNVSWSWRSFHPTFYAIYPAPSCCLPGVIFFRSTYRQVIDYLQQIECHSKYAIDTAFDDLPRKTSLRTYLIEPNLVHHIGLYSRLHHNYINPYLLD